MANWTRSQSTSRQRLTPRNLLAWPLALGLAACAGSLEDLAKAGDPEAQRKLGESFLSKPGSERTVSAKNSTPLSSSSTSEREGAHWIREAAKGGDAIAQRKLSELYYRGEGVERDYRQSARWSLAAAEQGDVEAQGFLAGLYRIGAGVRANLDLSLKWYRSAAAQGHAPSEYHLGAAYDFGAGVPKDRDKALQWYERAAEQGHHGAQYNLALLYLAGGDQSPPSPARGLKWLFIGNRTGSLKASEKLLEVHEVYRPEDVRKGFSMAREWLHARGVPDLKKPTADPRVDPGGAADGI